MPGRLLGSLPGYDPRPGVGLWGGLPTIDWVPIPDAGEFVYQKDERRTEPAFWIARYPVTYTQYRAFLEADDGYALDRWWREPESLAVPDGHRNDADQQRLKYWNHPAENVSWYEAIAFCHWLTAKVKAQVEAKVEGWEKLLPPELASRTRTGRSPCQPSGSGRRPPAGTMAANTHGGLNMSSATPT